MAYKNPLDERARVSRRKHYHNNKEQYYERNRIKKSEMRAYVAKIKSIPCMDCKINYPPYVMDLDHRDPSTKIDIISVLINRGSWRKLLEEIEKCDVVCANCHRERTHGGTDVIVA